MPILQFRVSLPECTFPLWRRFRVTDDYRFDRFHQVIQLAMGWDNYHLHDEDYNPEFFPIEEMNAELALFGAWHKKYPKARSTPWHIIE